MNLHAPEYFNASCGVSAVAIVTGEPFYRIKQKILKYRAKHPRNYEGIPCKRSQMMATTEYTFVHELIHYLRSAGIKIGKLRPWRDKGKIHSFCKKYPVGVYFVDLTEHIVIVKDGLIYDNGNIMQKPKEFYHKKQSICNFARLG